jgi:hypothetical protein
MLPATCIFRSIAVIIFDWILDNSSSGAERAGKQKTECQFNVLPLSPMRDGRPVQIDATREIPGRGFRG